MDDGNVKSPLNPVSMTVSICFSWDSALTTT